MSDAARRQRARPRRVVREVVPAWNGDPSFDDDVRAAPAEAVAGRPASCLRRPRRRGRRGDLAGAAPPRLPGGRRARRRRPRRAGQGPLPAERRLGAAGADPGGPLEAATDTFGVPAGRAARRPATATTGTPTSGRATATEAGGPSPGLAASATAPTTRTVQFRPRRRPGLRGGVRLRAASADRRTGHQRHRGQRRDRGQPGERAADRVPQHPRRDPLDRRRPARPSGAATAWAAGRATRRTGRTTPCRTAGPRPRARAPYAAATSAGRPRRARW